MGKGDKKTRRGKLFQGSYGKKRPRKEEKGTSLNSEKVVKETPKNGSAAPKEKPAPKPVREKKEEKSEKAPKEAPKPKKEKKA